MILIISSSEFSFIILLSFFLVHFTVKKKRKKSRIVSLLSCACPVLAVGVNVPVGLNCDQMEAPHEKQNSHYLVERNPNAYRSMRD